MKLFGNQKGNKELGKFLEGHIFQWKYSPLPEQGIWEYLFNRILKCYGTMTAMSHFLPFQMRMIIKRTILLFHPCMFGGCETDILSFWSLNLWIERSYIRTWCRTQDTEFWSSGCNWITLWGYVRRWRNFVGGRNMNGYGRRYRLLHIGDEMPTFLHPALYSGPLQCNFAVTPTKSHVNLGWPCNFHRSTCLTLCQCYTILIAVAL